MTETSESVNQWREWNAQGLFPGHDESESVFNERVLYCLNLKENLVKQVGADLPFDVNDRTSQKFLDEALPSTEQLYGIKPRWVPLFFSNYQLTPWHGGCAWIFQVDENTPTAAFLQLRAHFRSSPTYLGLYHRNELMTHELAHVGRMVYQEPQFEEIFAYQSSSSPLRRWFGPIVQSSKESLFFILIMGVAIIANLALLTSHSLATVHFSQWMMAVPFILILLALSRLAYRHYLFDKCSHHLEKIYQDPKTVKHLLYRLRDSEIKQFAKISPEKIREYIQESAKTSFRWRFLNSIYPLI